MKFKGELTQDASKRVRDCDERLHDPARLAALYNTSLMGSETEQAYDRLTELAALILDVPLTIVSLVDHDRQFFKAGFGLPPPYDSLREVPITSSICRYTLAGQMIVASDSSKDPLLKYHPTTEPWGIGAFIAIPMTTKEGQTLGAFCAVDPKPRVWSDKDIHILQELTASIMTEIELRTQLAELKIERDLRQQFVATLTHDLRTPLGIAKMSAQLITDSDNRAEDLEKFSKMISDNMDRADTMIQDLLDVSLMKAGEKVNLHLEACDLLQIANETISALSQLHGPRFKVVSEGPIHGEWDRSALRRMIENLANNAVKYGAPKKTVTLILTSDEQQAEIAVHNHASEDFEIQDLNDMFASFRRSEKAKQGLQKGWGLGLTLVRGFAEAHGGKASAESHPTAGTFFRIHLPKISTAVTSTVQ